MDHFAYDLGRLYAEQVPLDDLAIEYGTPLYVYSRATIERHWRAFDEALGGHPHLVCYAVKANSNLAVLNLLARLGSGFDIVSQGELERVLRAGGRADRIVFSGVGKGSEEIRAALTAGIRCFNVESTSELERISDIATDMGRIAPVSMRINPDVDALTHPYIATGLRESKFGIAFEDAIDVYLTARDLPAIEIVGLDCHIGSQLTALAPFIDALDRVLTLADRLTSLGIELHHLDLGGGLGVCYEAEEPPLPRDYAEAILDRMHDRHHEIIIEPGRAIMANAGILLTRIEYLKFGQARNFAIVDAAMNDLLRPALYDAWQAIIPVHQPLGDEPARAYDVVGPICESGDFLGRERLLAVHEGDLLAVRSAGAYGFSMSSNYNSRPRCAEVMVDGADHYLIRRRERIEELYRDECCLP